MATAANTVTGIAGSSRQQAGARSSDGKLHFLAQRLVKARNEVSRVERMLNIAVTELGRFGEDVRLELEPRSAQILNDRRTKVKVLRAEHEKVCIERDRSQRDYEKLPDVDKTAKGLTAINDLADEAVKECGSDINKALATHDKLEGVGRQYDEFIVERNVAHAREGLLNVRESLPGRGGAWMRTIEFEARIGKVIGKF